MNLLSHLPKLSTWTKAFTASLVAAAALSTSAFAASPETTGAGKPVELNASSAAAFLDQFFTQDEVKPLYVGASVVIVKDGQVLAEKGYGVADQTSGKPVDPASTEFRVASVSKTFTAVAVMQLVEQGKIKLDDNYLTYLPGYKQDNPFDQPVTIEDLLTHTSGFEVRDIQADDMGPNYVGKRLEMDAYAQSHMPPVVREPGTSYMYDNFAYLLLGLIVQKVSGEPFETYMTKHVFQPLGMANSSFLLDGHIKDNLATGYTAAGQALPVYDFNPTVLPQGGMLSTAEDIGKFMIAFLNGGASGSSRILADQTVQSMEQYRSSIHPLLPNTTYGFEAPFQIPGAGASSKIITKAGDMTDFSSYLFLIPEQHVGVFLTYNKQGALRNLFYPQFISAFYPQYAAQADFPAYKPQSADELDRFAGYYADIRAKVLVSAVNEGQGELTISDSYLGPRTLHQVDDNLFIDDLTKQFTAFQLDKDGKANYMKEPYLNPLGYEKKGDDPAGFADVGEDHPYAPYIYMLQSLGHYPNDGTQLFHPEAGVTRGDFVQHVLATSGVTAAEQPQYSFTDIKGLPSAPYIQLAFAIGMVKGDGQGKFHPEQVITRQEAAVMLQRVFALQYPSIIFNDVKLSGTTDAWAVSAVQMMVALGIYGPEIQPAADGSVDFHSKAALSNEEEAAIMYTLILQPTDQLIANLQNSGKSEAAAPNAASDAA
ncbi:serine hydrolase [Paenibacillus protaetiae]|uniref:serine hydrolase n=1 Tax=Paenibacillus protaetiae TaxID=2509456 RepID=UPI001FC9509B|nr:serine hydrolase [Paenibacillus protaetiae]